MYQTIYIYQIQIAITHESVIVSILSVLADKT